MSQLLRCDSCEDTAPEELVSHWWSVDRIGAGPDYHFCSYECLEAFAQHRGAI